MIANLSLCELLSILSIPLDDIQIWPPFGLFFFPTSIFLSHSILLLLSITLSFIYLFCEFHVYVHVFFTPILNSFTFPYALHSPFLSPFSCSLFSPPPKWKSSLNINVLESWTSHKLPQKKCWKEKKCTSTLVTHNKLI